MKINEIDDNVIQGPWKKKEGKTAKPSLSVVGKSEETLDLDLRNLLSRLDDPLQSSGRSSIQKREIRLIKADIRKLRDKGLGFLSPNESRELRSLTRELEKVLVPKPRSKPFADRPKIRTLRDF